MQKKKWKSRNLTYFGPNLRKQKIELRIQFYFSLWFKLFLLCLLSVDSKLRLFYCLIFFFSLLHFIFSRNRELFFLLITRPVAIILILLVETNLLTLKLRKHIVSFLHQLLLVICIGLPPSIAHVHRTELLSWSPFPGIGMY